MCSLQSVRSTYAQSVGLHAAVRRGPSSASQLGRWYSSRRSVHTRAGVLSEVSSQSAILGGLLVLSVSTVDLLRDVDRFQQGEIEGPQANRGEESDDDEGFVFSVSSVLSLIPFLSWLAWIFAAQNSRDRSKLYYACAAVYAFPALCQIESISSWYFATYALGALHFQVEALRETELLKAAAALETLPDGSKKVAQVGASASRQLTAFSEAFEYVIGEIKEKGPARVRLKEQADNIKEVQASKELQSAEAEQWESKLSKRLRDRE